MGKKHQIALQAFADSTGPHNTKAVCSGRQRCRQAGHCGTAWLGGLALGAPDRRQLVCSRSGSYLTSILSRPDRGVHTLPQLYQLHTAAHFSEWLNIAQLGGLATGTPDRRQLLRSYRRSFHFRCGRGVQIPVQPHYMHVQGRSVAAWLGGLATKLTHRWQLQCSCSGSYAGPSYH